MPERGWLRRRLTAVINDDNLDLYLLATIAMVFTVLGATGVSDIKVLSSVVLALLAILALSQIRSRRLTEQIRNAQRPDPTALFRRTFADDFHQRRAGAFDLLLIGLSMTRTVQVQHTLRLLAELRTSTQGALSVRLTSHPLAMGIVVTDGQPDGEVPSVFAEYYVYQAPEEPKFSLQPGAPLGYDLFVKEAEALWENGKPHELE